MFKGRTAPCVGLVCTTGHGQAAPLAGAVIDLLLGIPEDECRYGEVHLCLFRCKRCTLDRVYTRFDSSHWVLDETDYRPIGSLHNEGVPDLFEVFAEDVKAQRDAEAAKGLAEILDFGAFSRESREGS